VTTGVGAPPADGVVAGGLAKQAKHAFLQLLLLHRFGSQQPELEEPPLEGNDREKPGVLVGVYVGEGLGVGVTVGVGVLVGVKV
jgi:hypothetical protein